MDAGRWPFNEDSAGRGHIAHQGVARVVLHPLTEIGLGMFVAVVIGRRQCVMDLQRRRKRRHREQQAGKHQRYHAAEPDIGLTTTH